MIQKLIDAYELEREMYRKCMDTDEEIEKGRAKWDSGLWIRYKVFKDAITLAPRVDAVKHGRWYSVENYIHIMDSLFDLLKPPSRTVYVCSECGSMSNRKDNYCWNCGAKMDEVEDE